MSKVLDSKTVQDLLIRAVAVLAGDQAARKVVPAVDAALALARETATVGPSRKGAPTITAIKVSTGGAGGDEAEPVTTTVFSTREPIDSGPKKRVPIRTGGGTCFTVTIGKIRVTICIEWEN